MKKFIVIIFLIIGSTAFGKSIETTSTFPADFIPAGYTVVEELHGDLNNDNQMDYIFMVKGTDKSKFINHEYHGVLDRNRRGIVIIFKNKDKYDLIMKNLDCFSSENEDGGVYYPPELSLSINKGNLLIHYAHGRYGYWSYNFRYQNSNFELIGYNSNQSRGPVTEKTYSINFLTKKMLTKDNINKYIEDSREVFKETWKTFTVPKLIKLKDISSFDNLDVESLNFTQIQTIYKLTFVEKVQPNCCHHL